jgi:hypothetical protein
MAADWEQVVKEAAARVQGGGEAVVPTDVADRERVEEIVRRWLVERGQDEGAIEFTESEAGVKLSRSTRV